MLVLYSRNIIWILPWDYNIYPSVNDGVILPWEHNYNIYPIKKICSHGIPLIGIMSKAYPTMHCWSSDQCLEGCKKNTRYRGNGWKWGKKAHQPSRLGILWVLFGASPHKSRIFLKIGTSRYIQWLKVVPRDVEKNICPYDFTVISPWLGNLGRSLKWWHSAGLMKTWSCVHENVDFYRWVCLRVWKWGLRYTLNSHFLDNDENLLELGGTPFKTDD